MISLAIALAAVPAAPAPKIVQCRMMECSWSTTVSNVAIRSTSAGTLREITGLRGTSAHREDFPSRFDESIPIAWGKRTSTDYALCSRSRPAWAFRSGRRWVAHALELFDLPGYHTASAISYLRACHGIEYDRADIEATLRALGYRPGTRSDQVEIKRPEQLFALPGRSAE